ncbi:hypothetical protein BGZ47_009373 [Haplosporangium gracile]|nr:hypothetical protein BGZ47_009373 [Haplosporangium gracile]
MAKAPYKSDFYFAHQFNFHGIKDVGYTVLQFHENENGKSIVHAAFLSFQVGTTTKHHNCYPGADGGPSVSCAVGTKVNYGCTYNITVDGTLIDTVNKNATVIGEWTLPKGAGKTVNDQVGFVDQPFHTCDSLPYTQFALYHLTSKIKGAKNDKVTKVCEYGDCVGQAGYAVIKRSTGYDIKVSF